MKVDPKKLRELSSNKHTFSLFEKLKKITIGQSLEGWLDCYYFDEPEKLTELKQVAKQFEQLGFQVDVDIIKTDKVESRIIISWKDLKHRMGVNYENI